MIKKIIIIFVFLGVVYGEEECSSHGMCSCDYGWGGTVCNKECPGGFEEPCSNNGWCLWNLTCACHTGYVGEICELECPGGSDNPCSYNGLCNENATCTCNDGWRGVNCSLECPGGFENPCSFAGECTEDAICICDEGKFGERCNLNIEVETNQKINFFLEIFVFSSLFIVFIGFITYFNCREKKVDPVYSNA